MRQEVSGSINPGDLVPDKTLKWYKAAKKHRIVPFKTFSRDGMPVGAKSPPMHYMLA